MKRIYAFLVAASCGVSALQAQVVLTKTSHGLNSEGIHEACAVPYQEPGTAGRGLVWDFSAASDLRQNDPNVHSDLAPAQQSSANIQVSRKSDDVTFFYNVTDKSNEYWGYSVGNFAYQLTKPIVKTVYPQTYGTQFSGEYEGNYIVDGKTTTQTIKGTYSTHADATGTLILPGGKVFQSLRVKTTETINNYELVKYLWYVQEERYPVFVNFEEYTVGSDGVKTLHSTRSYMNALVKSPAAIKPVTDDVAYSVSPNPFKDAIKIEYYLPKTEKVTIELYDLGGKKLADLVSGEEQQGTLALTPNISQYTETSGIYVVKLTFGDKTYTQKILKK